MVMPVMLGPGKSTVQLRCYYNVPNKEKEKQSSLGEIWANIDFQKAELYSRTHLCK